jgi:hypothetical protein
VSSMPTAVRPPSGSLSSWASAWQRVASALPSWGLITTKNLELRRRRGLMAAVLVLILGWPVLILGFRLAFHLADPSKYGPAGSPAVFQVVVNPMAEFGFIMAATLGAAAGTTDLTDGVFRHLVATGRSRLALFLARVPAGLGIVLPVVAVGFTILCLVTSYAGTPQPTSVGVNGVSIPLSLDQSQLQTWMVRHPQQARNAFQGPVIINRGGSVHSEVSGVGSDYQQYTSQEVSELNPPVNEMVKIGLWLELVIGVGFIAGLGLGALTGQRTVSTIVMIALQIIVTPILAAHVIPYFINGQRLVVGVALDQLRPTWLASGGVGAPGGLLSGGRGVLQIPLMPTWQMILIIVGWIVGWSAIGAWRTATRDA